MARNVEDIPVQNKFVLGIGSVWMLFPLTYGIFMPRSLPQDALLLNLLVSFCASFMLWSNPTTNSFWHVLDQLAAILFFFGIAMNATVSWFWPWFLLTVCLYVCSYSAFQYGYYRLQLVSHLCFRFSAYWAAHWVFVPVKYHVHETYWAYFLLSITHVMHMMLLWRMANFRFRRSYLSRTTAPWEVYWRVLLFSIIAVVGVMIFYEFFIVLAISRSVLPVSPVIEMQTLDTELTYKTPLSLY